ncbi:MAG: LysR family transcriptional regulator [Alphaproteobacteria bacterium]|nr:LysR family transcriptional regulator [Alphaproteobacteria bacterium]
MAGMEIHQIRYFLAVCETLNFTRAAEACNVSQPALTRAIKALEEELGGELLRRERNLTHLTELGRLVREPLALAMAETERTKKEAAAFLSLGDAPLNLGVMYTIGPSRLVGILDHLYRTAPGIQIKLRDGTPAAILETLMAGGSEIAVLTRPDAAPERLEIVPLYRERFVIAFPAGHRFAEKNAIRIEDMKGENYLLRLECEMREVIQHMREERSIPINIRCQSQREDWIQSMILAGMGCAFMPESMPMLPGIETRPVMEDALQREVCLAMVAGRRFSPAVKAFVGLAAKFSGERKTK